MTSVGLLELVLTSHRRHGLVVTASTFDERGWEQAKSTWAAEPILAQVSDPPVAGGSLASFLSDAARAAGIALARPGER